MKISILNSSIRTVKELPLALMTSVQIWAAAPPPKTLPEGAVFCKLLSIEDIVKVEVIMRL